MPRGNTTQRVQVRIIGGKWKGRKLQVTATAIRPTPDRTRVTLFNWLAADLPGARVLDLFAGSGALGLEALSRGARQATFVDHDRNAIDGLVAHRERLDATDAVIEHADALPWLVSRPSDERWDVIFLDPPFDSTMLTSAVDAAAGRLAENGVIYAESDGNFDWEAAAAACGLRIRRRSRAGIVRYGLFCR